MTDGPYAETKEQMGGFWVIEAPISTPLWNGPVERLRRATDQLRSGPRKGDRRPRRGVPARSRPLHSHGDPRPRRHRPRRGRRSEAFAIAAEQWPKTGIPPNPGGWITTAARNRAIDRLRRESTRSDGISRPTGSTPDTMGPARNPDLDRLDDFVEVVADDQLRLMFLCAHPP